MLNPIFWKKAQGQKRPGSWGIVEHQIPSIKVLFKTITKSHKHHGIKLLSSETKTQLVNQRKQKVASNPGNAHSPEIQIYKMWLGAASPILNDTPVVCIYTSYNKTHINNAYIYIYIYYILTQSFRTGTKVFRRKNGCDYLSMLGLKLNHVSKRGPLCAYYCSDTSRPCVQFTKHILLWLGFLLDIRKVFLIDRRLIFK